MAVETPNRSAISPLRFFNRTAKVNQQGPAIEEIDGGCISAEYFQGG